jgi:hypothetical protein
MFKTGIKIFFLLEFVTFFACPKKVTKEKTPKSNARDGFPRTCLRFQPFCSSSFAFAEIGSHANTTFSHPPRFRFPTAQNSIWTAWNRLTTQLLCTLVKFKLKSMLFGHISTYLGQQ